MQIGKAVFDPLLESSETVYLGLGDGQPWRSVKDSGGGGGGGGGQHSDPSDDVEQFSQLWKSWSSRLDEGKHS